MRRRRQIRPQSAPPPLRSRARRRRASLRCRTARPAAPTRHPEGVEQRRPSANGSTVGTAAPSGRRRSDRIRPARARPGTLPRPVSSVITPSCSGAPSTNAVPSVGCPANGSSKVGVKIRIRDVAAALGREDEHRLAEADLERERLHRLVVQPARVGEDGELVSRQGRVGEDVGDDVAERLHRLQLSLRSSFVRARSAHAERLTALPRPTSRGACAPRPRRPRRSSSHGARGACRVDQREVQVADERGRPRGT